MKNGGVRISFSEDVLFWQRLLFGWGKIYAITGKYMTFWNEKRVKIIHIISSSKKTS